MTRFRLKQGSQELALPPGDFFIGRSPDCQLTLDDPLVSRRHAVVHVDDEQATLEDLGSRNGVLLNGERLHQDTRPLQPGDRIVIGGQELVVSAVTPVSRPRELGFTQSISTKDDPPRTVPAMRAAPTPPPPRPAPRPTPGPEPETRRASAFVLLLGVASKALALGKVDDAERILTNLVTDWERQLAASSASDPMEGLEDAAMIALQIARARNTVTWVDWIFEAYRAARRVLPAPVIDELHTFVRRMRYPAGTALRAYVESLRSREPLFSPAERFLVKRIEGLLEVAAAN